MTELTKKWSQTMAGDSRMEFASEKSGHKDEIRQKIGIKLVEGEVARGVLCLEGC
jgi:hypothetical protein